MSKSKKNKIKIPKELEEMYARSHPDFQEHLRNLIKITEESKAKGIKISPDKDEIIKAQNALLEDIKKYPKGSFILMDDYIDRLGVSQTYGYYPRSKPVLNIFWNKKSGMDDKELINALIGPFSRLSKEIEIFWQACILPYKEHHGSIIIRIMVFALTREKIINFIEEDSDEVPFCLDSEMIQYRSLQFLGQKLANYLEEDGFSASYPKTLTHKDMENPKELELLRDKKIALDIQYAGKDMVEFGLGRYIHKTSESPIESRLASSLVLHGLPPLINIEIIDPDYKGKFTKADLVIMSEPEPLLIYADGAKYHGPPHAQTHDKRIDRRLQELGFQVIRISGSDIYSNIERIVEDIKGRLFGKAAHILPEEIWLPKINKALKLAKTPSDKSFLKSILEHINEGKRITVKQEKYLNRICRKLGIERAYEWLDILNPTFIKEP